jgi:hypothetical protein
MSDTIYTTLEIGGRQIEIEVTYDYTPGTPGKTYGPPEKCYPPEPDDVDIISVKNLDSGADIDFDSLPKQDRSMLREMACVTSAINLSDQDDGSDYERDYD